MNKKILFFSIFFFSLALAPHVLAQGFTALAPIPGLTDPITAGSVISSSNFANFFNNLYKFVIGFAAMSAVVMIVWGGLEISTQDSISKQGAGRERITQAIYGLILVLSPVLVFSLINPSILRLSLNLPKLDLQHAAYAPVTVVLPPCVLGNRPPKCIDAAPTLDGLSATPISGRYCFKRKTSNATSFICSASETNCKTMHDPIARGRYSGISAESDCVLTP